MSNSGAGSVFAVFICLLVVGYIVAVLLMTVIFYALIFGGLLLSFIAFCWSFVCMMAWRSPFQLGWLYVTPRHARAFIIRGLFGATVLPLFLGMCHLWLNYAVNWNYLPHFATAGYVLLSVGLELIAGRALGSDEDQAPRSHPHVIEGQTQHQRALLPDHSSFSYASWDDEEERS